MKDRRAVVWTRLGTSPVKMGELLVTDRESRFSYEDSYAATGLRGLGLVYEPALFDSTIVRARTEYFDLHPPFKSLIPSRDQHNFQRALILKALASMGITPAPGFETDWEILIRSGHGGIGHLDVFENDKAAEAWFSTPSSRKLVELENSEISFSLKEFLTWYDGDVEPLIKLIGPTPSVGGAIPKLPLSIPRTGWNGQIGLPTRFGDSDRMDILLKLENSNQYPGIIELETLGLDLHREAGFEVPQYWPVKINDLNAIAIERFDRTENGTPLFMESMYSILASGSNAITHHYSTSYDSIGLAIDNPNIKLVSDRTRANFYLLDRLLLAMLTGNGDLHLENLSIYEHDGTLAFTPVYDPVPMRAYSIHDAIYPQGMGFGSYAEEDRKGNITGFKQAWLNFSKLLDIREAQLLNRIEHMLKVCDDFESRVYELETLPTDNKKRLVDIHKTMRTKFADF